MTKPRCHCESDAVEIPPGHIDGCPFADPEYDGGIGALEKVSIEVYDPWADAPYVCPGCHTVGGGPCLPGCIDAEIEAERESGECCRDDDCDHDESEGDW